MNRSSSSVLCVDLDGTLIAGDVFWESLLLLARRQPWACLLLPLWLCRGRAYAKRQVALRVALDPASLPYRPEVLEYIAERQKLGGPVVLATASDDIPARAVAAHLGVFDDVHASDGHINLSGREKADRLVQLYGPRGFEYLGNGHVDLPAWMAAGGAVAAGASRTVIQSARRHVDNVTVLTDAPPSKVLTALEALRPIQWLKNVLVFVPVLASHHLPDAARLEATFATFVALCLAASGVYVCNDILDIQADRAHPRKRHRPFAAGRLSVPVGIAMSVLLVTASLIVGALATSPGVCAIIGVYLVASTAYSFWIKKFAIYDVFLLTGLYVLRVFAGGVSASVQLSAWLLGFALFGFLTLALLKRHTELAATGGRPAGRGYAGEDETWLMLAGMVAAYTSVVILALYVASPEVTAMYSRPRLLWTLCPLLLMWFSRVWLRASRRELTDDPIRTAITDPMAYAVVILVAAIAMAAV